MCETGVVYLQLAMKAGEAGAATANYVRPEASSSMSHREDTLAPAAKRRRVQLASGGTVRSSGPSMALNQEDAKNNVYSHSASHSVAVNSIALALSLPCSVPVDTLLLEHF